MTHFLYRGDTFTLAKQTKGVTSSRILTINSPKAITEKSDPGPEPEYIMSTNKNLSPIEKIKTESDALRGTLKESLHDEVTGAIRENDQALIKFHGMYQQDDRDRREERSAKKLEWLYSYMVRLRLPGGFLTPEQWVGLHHHCR